MYSIKKITLLLLTIFIIFPVYGEDASKAKTISTKELLEIPDDILNLGINNPESTDSINDVNCFDYYKFQSVNLSLESNKSNYKAWDTMLLYGKASNNNSYPIVDGNIFARFSKKNKKYSTEWQYNIKEFIIANNISILNSGSVNISYDWQLPEYLVTWEYRLDFFYSVWKKFNLWGLPFSNEVVINSIDFNIKSENKWYIGFDKSSTKVNNEKYLYIGNWPNIKQGRKVIINQALVNAFNKSKKIEITYDLYYWDSLNKDDLISTKKETIELGWRKKKLLTYKIDSMNESVYYLKITAKELESWYTSIVNIRITSPIAKARINFPAITKFPIKNGDNFTLFSCFHSTSSVPMKWKLEVKIIDKDWNIIDKINYEWSIPSSMSAIKQDIVASKNYNILYLSAILYDQKWNIVDNYDTVYNCENFDLCENKKIDTIEWWKEPKLTVDKEEIWYIEESNNKLIIVIIVVIWMLFIWGIWLYIRKKRK